MKVESTIKPKKYEIQSVKNGKTTILFFDNVEETERTLEEAEETETIYTYEMYKIELHNRADIEEEIETNYISWLNYAKELEYKNLATKIRAKRDKLLNETDWTQMQDTALSSEEVENYKTYRQALRDITAQDDFPNSVKFPEMP